MTLGQYLFELRKDIGRNEFGGKEEYRQHTDTVRYTNYAERVHSFGVKTLPA